MFSQFNVHCKAGQGIFVYQLCPEFRKPPLVKIRKSIKKEMAYCNGKNRIAKELHPLVALHTLLLCLLVKKRPVDKCMFEGGDVIKVIGKPQGKFFQFFSIG